MNRWLFNTILIIQLSQPVGCDDFDDLNLELNLLIKETNEVCVALI